MIELLAPIWLMISVLIAAVVFLAVSHGRLREQVRRLEKKHDEHTHNVELPAPPTAETSPGCLPGDEWKPYPGYDGEDDLSGR